MNTIQIHFELHNLERMGLMESETKIQSANRFGDRISPYIDFTGYYNITSFGLDFIEACTIKENKIN